MIRCVVFDFDGTLVRSNEIKVRIFYEVVEPFDCPLEIVEAALASPSPGNRYQVLGQIAERLAEKGLLSGSCSVGDAARMMSDEYSALCEKAIANCPEVAGAERTLGWLRRQGYSTFLNSATPRAHLQRLVGLRSLDLYFVGVYGGPASKATNLRRIFMAAGVKGEEILTVGDGDDDRAAAVATGCHFAGLAAAGVAGPSRFMQPPEYTLVELADVERVIASIDQGSGAPEPSQGGAVQRPDVPPANKT